MARHQQRHQCAADQPSRHFEIAGEQFWRGETDEHATCCAPDRQHQVKARQVAGRRLGRRQLAMTKHAGQEQAEAVERNRLVDVEHTALRSEAPSHHAQHHQCRAEPEFAHIKPAPAAPFKHQHERKQIQSQRQYPEEGNRRHVLRDMVRNAQQHQRGQRSKSEPDEIVRNRWWEHFFDRHTSEMRIHQGFCAEH